MSSIFLVQVESVSADGIAEAVGIKINDILETYNETILHSPSILNKAIESGDDKVSLTLYRGGEKLHFQIPNGRLGVALKEIEFYPERYLSEHNLRRRVESVAITTVPSFEGYRIVKTLDVVTAECVFGLNAFKYFFMGVTDFFGVRSKTAQDALRSARKNCLYELKKEAAELGANAIVGIDLDYSEFSGQGKSMLFLVASGTAVIVEPIA